MKILHIDASARQGDSVTRKLSARLVSRLGGNNGKGGTTIDSEIDFLTPWLGHFLGFMGIKVVTVISAEALNQDFDAGLAQAERQLAKAA